MPPLGTIFNYFPTGMSPVELLALLQPLVVLRTVALGVEFVPARCTAAIDPLTVLKKD